MEGLGGGGVEAVREGQYHPHLPPLHSYSPSTFPPTPPLPIVPVMSHGGDGDGARGVTSGPGSPELIIRQLAISLQALHIVSSLHAASCWDII